VFQFGLAHNLGVFGIGNVDAGEILRRAFVGDPQNPAAFVGDLQGHALTDATEAIEGIMRKKLHVVRLCFGHACIS